MAATKAASSIPSVEKRRDDVRCGAVGPTVMRLAEAAASDGDILFIAATEQRAEQLADALRPVLPTHDVHYLPASDTLPGDGEAASASIAGRRVAVLHAIMQTGRRPVILIASVEAASRRIAPPASFEDAGLVLSVDDPFDAEALTARCSELGYFEDDRIDEPGEIAWRTMLDIFPAADKRPVRIEHGDGRVSSIRRYDAITQLSDEELETITIGAAVEPMAPRGSVSLFDHLPDATLAIDPGVDRQRQRFLELVEDTLRTRTASKGAGSAATVVDDASWTKAVAGRVLVDVAAGDEQEGERFVEKAQPKRALLKAIREAQERDARVVLLGSERDLRFLSRRVGAALKGDVTAVESWHEVAKAPAKSLLLLETEVERGWRTSDLLAIATADILGSRAAEHNDAETLDPLAGGSTELRIGDAVLHEEHGIGVVRGLESVEVDGARQDAVRLEYARDSDRLVPVAEFDRVWRYGADEGAVTLDTLSGASWQKRRVEIDAAIAETARGLTELAAQRAARTAPEIDPPATAYERFAGRFPFTETRDQARAIAAVRDDLAAGRPMDRLVVGDVGYGKTEVALRAAAMVALSGRQVAMVAPTTVLVRQHLETFRRRFAGMDIHVEGLSRLSTPAEARAVKQGLADGSVDIVVGTQAVAGKSVSFKALALMIIDEEQRFGAADKLKLRSLSEDVHLLTLTATPIPRTLQAALVGIQQLSVIATPPARRQPIRTTVEPFDPATARSALLREKTRGGQSFMVVPRIEDMAPLAEQLRGLVPELAVVQAHGKMDAASLDETMVGFAEGEGDVLLATNIIEAGLDVPRANTMIVWHADRFGLSQLHQLRGRVGRGARRGRILLTTEPGTEIAPATLKRLRTLEALDRLGAGFAISARDLDLRGAGDLLGDEQAGHMKLIGVDLYQHLLTGALRAARGEEVDMWVPELHLGSGGSLPGSWIAEPELRLNLHARIAHAASAGAIEALADEMEDRFGALPPEAQRLVAAARIRQLAHAARIARIDAGPAAIALTPRRDFGGDIEQAGLVRKNDRLLLKRAIEDEDERLAAVAELLETLAPDAPAA